MRGGDLDMHGPAVPNDAVYGYELAATRAFVCKYVSAFA
jgi:hypothetical protein